MFLLAVPKAERVDCETVEDESEHDNEAHDWVEFVEEAKVDQQLDLDETVEGEFHDVRFDDHDEQTPPNEGRA